MTDALENRLEELKKDYAKTKYNKATNKYLGILRAKMAKIRKQMSSKKGKKGVGFAVKKTGDATIALVGFPNAGKSSILNTLTGVESKVADYAFTTLEVIPGMLEINGAKIQMLDTPGLIEHAHIGKGEGTKIASAIRVVDLILFVVDVNDYEKLFKLINELSELGIDFKSKARKVRIDITSAGGLHIGRNGRSALSDAEITSVMSELGVFNANIVLMSGCTMDDILDTMADDKIVIRSIVALNKIDISKDYKKVKADIESRTGMEVVPISAKTGHGAESLKKALFDNLGLVRVFLKERGGRTDFEKPLVVRRGSTIIDVARKVHADLAKEIRHAYVTGKSVKFQNQRVSIEHVVDDGDIVTFIS